MIIDCRRNDFTDKLFKKEGYDFEAEGSAEEINSLIIERLQKMDTPAARKSIREIRTHCDMAQPETRRTLPGALTNTQIRVK